MPGKRSNPAKLRKERELIIRDREERDLIPQSERIYPDFPEKVRRSVWSVRNFFSDLDESKRAQRNPPPREQGAKVIGFKKRNPPV